MFAEYGLLGNVVILLAALAALVFSSERAIENSVKVADVTGLGKTIVGFVLVAFATSIPELMVAVFAVLSPETSELSIGNVLGANILNIALILGICILIVTLRRPRYRGSLLRVAKEETGSLHFGLFVASIVPLSLLYIGHASRFIGVLLLLIFIYYMVQLARSGKTTGREREATSHSKGKVSKYGLYAIASVVVVAVCAFFIVASASYIAESLGIPAIIIGATIVSFGTTLPEMATSISSVRKGHFNLALGNLVGSCFVNITCILGVALIASAPSIDVGVFSNIALFSLIANLFLWYFLSSERLSWREGALLLFLYVVFIVVSFGSLSA